MGQVMLCSRCREGANIQKQLHGGAAIGAVAVGVAGFFIFWPLCLLAFVIAYYGQDYRCPKCGNRDLIPANSEAGRAMLEQNRNRAA